MTFSSILFLFFFLPAALLFCRYDVFIPPSVESRMWVETKNNRKPVYSDFQPVLLRVGRAEIYRDNDIHDTAQLYLRAAYPLK